MQTYGTDLDPTLAKNRSKTYLRMGLVVGVVFFVLLFASKMFMPIIGGYFPEKHPAYKLADQAQAAMAAHDYNWLIEHTDPAEVKQDGLNPELLKKVVDIVFKDPENGLRSVNEPGIHSLWMNGGTPKTLRAVSYANYFKDQKGRLFLRTVRVINTGSSGQIQGLLGSLLGGTAVNWGGKSSVLPTQISLLTPKQISQLSALGIKRITYPASEGTQQYPLSDAVGRQQSMLPSLGDYEAGILKKK